MNFQLVIVAFLLSLPVLGAQIIKDKDTHKIFQAFGVSGSAFVGSCSKFGEDVYLCSSHVIDNMNLWRELNQREARKNNFPNIQTKEIEKSSGPFQTSMILTFEQQKTIILESTKDGFVGKEVLGIQTIKQIAYSRAEKYSILAFTEDASKLSLSLPEFHEFPHRLAFSSVVNWKIYFSMSIVPNSFAPMQIAMNFEHIFVHASKATDTLLIHQLCMPPVMTGGLIWTPENKLVGIMVANIETWKENHSFEQSDAMILLQSSNSHNFGFTPSQEEPNSFDIELKNAAVGQLLSANDIIRAYEEYVRSVAQE